MATKKEATEKRNPPKQEMQRRNLTVLNNRGFP